MERAKKPPIFERPEFSIHTVSLSEDAVETLVRLSRDATDFLGRSVSMSAIVRALVRQVDQHGPPTADALFRLVEKELQDGVRWGKQK